MKRVTCTTPCQWLACSNVLQSLAPTAHTMEHHFVLEEWMPVRGRDPLSVIRGPLLFGPGRMSSTPCLVQIAHSSGNEGGASGSLTAEGVDTVKDQADHLWLNPHDIGHLLTKFLQALGTWQWRDLVQLPFVRDAQQGEGLCLFLKTSRPLRQLLVTKATVCFIPAIN